MSKRLYIIGNGFDIFHGIKSRYSDFRDFVEEKEPNLFEALDEYFVADELWSDFEETLAHIDTDKIVDDASDFLVSYSADDWSDANHHDYQYEMQRAINVITVDLRENFLNWILNLDIPKVQKITLSKDAQYLVFNYTPTLQQNYSIPENQILYIHKKAIDTDSEIILGHSRELTPENSFNHYKDDDDMDSYDVRVMEGNKILDDYFESTYKNTSTIIAENEAYFNSLLQIEEIFILGHSISTVDLPYFLKVFRSVRANIKWNVSYFGDMQRPIDILKSIGVDEKNINPILLTDL
ncbi:bacteriophage abortive infection AbiH family protein [Flavobacterium chungangense]|uniref:Bacteriophage abortive infection AbiH n=1 Tax=Flavobacterium chungangense TaxID=554283 RepID=A0A6V6ZDE4_9FLAO|nr:bacteriophage abortive infection AbiH family protein [Flavobacterium chungangense]CAD0009464.1 hypothetical protein FLACHUCJ7_04251 [Flavobacterium chungangense]